MSGQEYLDALADAAPAPRRGIRMGSWDFYANWMNQWRFGGEDIDIFRLSFTKYLPHSLEVQISVLGIEVFFGFERAEVSP
jgi:hypothetical protein